MELDCSYLLAHKDRVADPEAEQCNRHEGNNVRQDDDQALDEGQRILKARH